MLSTIPSTGHTDVGWPRHGGMGLRRTGTSEPGREGPYFMKPLSVPPMIRRLGAAAAGVVLLAGLLPAQASAAPEPTPSAGKAANASGAEELANYDSREAIQRPPTAAVAKRAAAAAAPTGAVRKLRD